MNAPKMRTPGGNLANADTKHSTAIVAPAAPLGKEYTTLQAEFALLGHSLNHSRRADDGRVNFIVARWNQARHFSHLNDVRAFLTQIRGRA